jgi:hypothetical protein
VGALPTFGFVTVHESPLVDGAASEADWLARAAATGRASAHLWRGAAGFSAPRSYQRLPRWAEACSASRAGGWPVQLRPSGGGLVPQGPGLLNLSLAWPRANAAPVDFDAVYRELAAALAAAFDRLDITTSLQSVEGSFCDGRFNLAYRGRKLVGTAQAWRRVGGQPVVLAHAVIVASADPALLTEAANRFESMAGSERCYRADALTSVAEAWCDVHQADDAPADIEARVATCVSEQFARLIPPLGSVDT